MSTPHIVAGIDPGTHTGLATWHTVERKLMTVETLPIHKAMARVEAAHRDGALKLVVFEDARLRMWFGRADHRMARSGAGIREGVGSVKRESGIWEDFLRDLGCKFEAVKPQAGMTKLDAARFAKLTGWTARTSNHARDAAMLVIGRG